VSRRDSIDAAVDDRPRPDESFLQRFHRRKTEARLTGTAPTTGDAAASTAAPPADADASGREATATPTPPPPPTDADMPPLESLTVDSDYSGFLSERVSEGLRRAALRKLFHSAEFNVVDGLDEYAEDYTTFEALGGILTADMRHQLEVEARKKAEALREALVGGEDVEPADSPAEVPVEVAGDAPDGGRREVAAKPPAPDNPAAKQAVDDA
jgi:hypothetical protein